MMRRRWGRILVQTGRLRPGSPVHVWPSWSARDGPGVAVMVRSRRSMCGRRGPRATVHVWPSWSARDGPRVAVVVRARRSMCGRHSPRVTRPVWPSWSARRGLAIRARTPSLRCWPGSCCSRRRGSTRVRRPRRRHREALAHARGRGGLLRAALRTASFGTMGALMRAPSVSLSVAASGIGRAAARFV